MAHKDPKGREREKGMGGQGRDKRWGVGMGNKRERLSYQESEMN